MRQLTLVFHEIGEFSTPRGFAIDSADRYTIAEPTFRSILRRISEAEGSYDQISVTIDDGGGTNLRAADLLEEFGMRGSFLVTTARLGAPGFICEKGVRELRDRGHAIGSHSHSHPHVFRSLSPAAMAKEWRLSRRVLEDILEEEVITASVPGGDMSTSTIRTCGEAGYTTLMTSEPRTKLTRRAGVTLVGRICVDQRTPDARIGHWLSGSPGALLHASSMRIAKNVARRGAGPVYRKYVALRTASKG